MLFQQDLARMLSNGLRHALWAFCVLQVGNLGLLFMLLFFIYAALGVELFGELGECTEHATKKYVTWKPFFAHECSAEDFSFGQILLWHFMDYLKLVT